MSQININKGVTTNQFALDAVFGQYDDDGIRVSFSGGQRVNPLNDTLIDFFVTAEMPKSRLVRRTVSHKVRSLLGLLRSPA